MLQYLPILLALILVAGLGTIRSASAIGTTDASPGNLRGTTQKNVGQRALVESGWMWDVEPPREDYEEGRDLAERPSGQSEAE